MQVRDLALHPDPTLLPGVVLALLVVLGAGAAALPRGTFAN